MYSIELIRLRFLLTSRTWCNKQIYWNMISVSAIEEILTCVQRNRKSTIFRRGIKSIAFPFQIRIYSIIIILQFLEIREVNRVATLTLKINIHGKYFVFKWTFKSNFFSQSPLIYVLQPSTIFSSNKNKVFGKWRHTLL